MYKIHRFFFGYESKQMPNALTPSEAAFSKNPGPTLRYAGLNKIRVFLYPAKSLKNSNYLCHKA